MYREGEEPPVPFSLNDLKTQRVVNSELKFESWFIENPVSKELTKRITLKLSPKAEQDFIIIVKSPNVRKPENLISLLSVGLLTYKHEQFGVKQSFEELLKSKYEGNMKAFLQERKELSSKQRQQVLLTGRVEVPKLVCLKEIKQYEVNYIPIALKRGGQQFQIQKFRIPYRNQGTQDLDVEFQFMRTSAAFN